MSDDNVSPEYEEYEPPAQEVRTFHYTQAVTALALRRPLRPERFVDDHEAESTDEDVFRECWAENVYRIEPTMLRRGGVVVDIGANIGAFTLLALAMQPGVRVVAVEPDEENAGILKENLAVNGWTDRVDVVPVAVHENDGRAHMESRGGGAHAIVDDGGDVPVWTMHDLLDTTGVDGVDFLKLDCEGAEYAIVRSMRRDDVLRRVRYLAMEFHTVDEATWGQMICDLVTTHSVQGIIGQPSTGGMLWAHRNQP